MGKNIILCSDGTGNKGGYGADSNVFKTYLAIDLNTNKKEQITFYDNGVGTNENKYFRALSGAFGFGFSENIIDLYEFLARNYEKGDEIFLFGFSRGAATVRAFAGMIDTCGLLDVSKNNIKYNNFINEELFLDKVKDAFKAYKDPCKTNDFKNKWAIIDPKYAPEGKLIIKFIGVWDTVSALGFPKGWSSGLVESIFDGVDKISDYIWPHRFYNYQLDENVKHVYHALAIDDERKTFHPKVWDECKENRPEQIEQVWFAGTHSNVGGGYPRSGLSDVALDWMITRAKHHGIVFKDRVVKKVSQRANCQGKLYDSRDGFALYYRYDPRNITHLCDKKIKDTIKIHQTVFDRMKRKTAGYAPGSLPGEFDIVDNAIGHQTGTKTIRLPNWLSDHEKINTWIKRRKTLYRIFVESTIIIVLSCLYLWIKGKLPIPVNEPQTLFIWLMKHIADIFRYFLPRMFDNFITYIFIVQPYAFPIITAFIILLYRVRRNFKDKTNAACNELRKSLLEVSEKETETP